MGLEGKHQSIGVRKQMVLEGMREPFQGASRLLEGESGIYVSSKEIQLESEEIGSEVAMELEKEVEALWMEHKEIKLASCPERLYITTDGTGVRTEDGHKEVKIGMTSVSGAIASNIEYTGGFAEAEDFGNRLYVLAARRDTKKQRRVCFWEWNSRECM